MRALWLITVLGLAAASATAAGAADSLSKTASSGANPAEINAFGVPAKSVAVIENQPQQEQKASANLPECDAPGIVEQIQSRIAAFQAETKPENTYDRRARKLAEKNIGQFTPLDLAKFIPSDNYLVADRLITLKVNQKLSDHDFRLCVGSNPLTSRQLYLLIYPALGGEGVAVDVLNFQNAGQPLTFQYREP